jgi:hypothetical protein
MPRDETSSGRCEAAEYLCELTRLFIAASRSATSRRTKIYCAERAFELAQRAEQFCPARPERRRTPNRDADAWLRKELELESGR